MRIHRSVTLLAAACLVGATSVLAESGSMPLPAATGRTHRAAAKASPSSPNDVVLYTQADNDASGGAVSQDFEPLFDTFDSDAADDFVIPSGQAWVINSVTMNGQYTGTGGPAPAVNLTIFADSGGVPGTAACTYPLQTPADSSGTFTFTLPSSCTLSEGTYWLDVQAVLNFLPGTTEWKAEVRSVQSNSPALWRNPGNGFGFGCSDWSNMQTCLSAPGPDLMFSLSGALVIVTPVALLVDESGTGNLDGVLEMGETVTISPSWANGTADAFTLQGLVTDFSGTAGPTYMVNDGTADYGAVAGGATSNCETATGDCMAVTITGDRPAQHFDATLTEQPSVGFSAATAGLPPKVWTLHVGESFTDVPTTDNFYKYIETIYHFGVTGGCGAGTDYCPANTVTRAQMAVFLLKAKNGSEYTPPACSGTVFADVPCTGGIFDPWIEDLANQGITGGCGGGNYCPANAVTRAQMAVFLEKTLRGAPYVPPACTGTVFGDVPCTGGIFDPWIEKLYADGVTGGCQASPLLYCPDNPNTRGQMAVFLTKTFSLVLYGP
jgi:S-layer homology domain